jgi:hypothetical protein
MHIFSAWSDIASAATDLGLGASLGFAGLVPGIFQFPLEFRCKLPISSDMGPGSTGSF